MKQKILNLVEVVRLAYKAIPALKLHETLAFKNTYGDKALRLWIQTPFFLCSKSITLTTKGSLLLFFSFYLINEIG